MRTLRRFGPLLCALVLCSGLARGGEKGPFPCIFEEAKLRAIESGLPILLRADMGWCTSCNAFDKAMEEPEGLRTDLERRVVLCTVDIKEGDGPDLAKMYRIPDYPMLSFLLLNEDGDLMDRWMGYYSRENFIKHFDSALENPIPVYERAARYRRNPNEIDARKLGELKDYEGHFAEAAAYYRRAMALNPASDTHYEFMILSAMAWGLSKQLYDPEEILVQANLVTSSPKTKAKELIKLGHTMEKVARKAGDWSFYTPFLRLAVESNSMSQDEKTLKGLKGLLPDYALLVEKNETKAVELMKEAYAAKAAPKEWTQNADMLNNLAWWCFEHRINLKEAERLARQGIELAEPGNQKANIYDTLAEICNASGSCVNAVEYIRLAVAEDPENEYFQDQLTRFENLLATQD